MIAFKEVNRQAAARVDTLLSTLLPGGRREGSEWVAINPRRDDRSPGSFRINMNTGRWADFATSDKGGDFVSLAAYVLGLRQGEAAQRVADIVGGLSYDAK